MRITKAICHILYLFVLFRFYRNISVKVSGLKGLYNANEEGSKKFANVLYSSLGPRPSIFFCLWNIQFSYKKNLFQFPPWEVKIISIQKYDCSQHRSYLCPFLRLFRYTFFPPSMRDLMIKTLLCISYHPSFYIITSYFCKFYSFKT
jgi:hypothetical protein